MKQIPRIRARVGTGDDDKYYFEVSIWDFFGEKQIGDPITIGPWDTEAIAHEEMKNAVKLSCEAIEKGQGFEPSGKYLDMKNGGILRPWINN